MATATSKYLNRSTPNVYITEIDAFGTSIVGVPTGVPIFIGYTQFASDPTTGQSLYNKPVQISSMSEYANYFGGAAVQGFTIAPPPPAPTTGSGTKAVTVTPSFWANTSAISGSTAPSTPPTPTLNPFMLAPVTVGAQFNLYWQLRLFYANGGGDCYIVSAGSYWTGENPLTATDAAALGAPTNKIALGDPDNDPAAGGLLVGLGAAEYAKGPTMTVIPEACQLFNPNAGPTGDPYADYATLIGNMLEQAARLQDRVAIIDLPGCMSANTIQSLGDAQDNLATALAPYIANASYGAAYAPALNTSIVSSSDILFTNLLSDDNSLINNILTTQAVMLYSGKQLASVQQAIAAAFPVTGGANTFVASGDAGTPPVSVATSAGALSVDNLLLNTLPIFAHIEQLIANTMNVAPPSGAIAGVRNKSDVQTGVWNAPANIALASVVSPLYNMSDAEQGGFNVPTNGQAIDIIRAQPGRGNVVWGARTLDGNSQDYRYIQVRRTLIYIEQTIKLALQSYVFAANDALTWTNVTSSISAFLTGLWQQGGLMGAKSSDAFTVNCGLGATMTAQDVLNGYMVVAVTLQMIHPAEFIELTFTQTMGS